MKSKQILQLLEEGKTIMSLEIILQLLVDILMYHHEYLHLLEVDLEMLQQEIIPVLQEGEIIVQEAHMLRLAEEISIEPEDILLLSAAENTILALEIILQLLVVHIT